MNMLRRQEDSRVHLHQSTSNWMKIRRAFGFFLLILSSAAWRRCSCHFSSAFGLPPFCLADHCLPCGVGKRLHTWWPFAFCFAFCFNSLATQGWSGLPFLRRLFGTSFTILSSDGVRLGRNKGDCTHTTCTSSS